MCATAFSGGRRLQRSERFLDHASQPDVFGPIVLDGRPKHPGVDLVVLAGQGLFRRLVHVHELDRLALDEAEAQAALNPQARAAFALLGPDGDALLRQFTASSGTPAQVRARIEQYIADGRSDYLVLQLPTGDMTMEEAKRSLQLFIDEVMPNFV